MVIMVQSDALNCMLADEHATLNAGRALAKPLAKPPLVVWLNGQLGAGKTTWVRGFLRGLGHEGTVKSPTYAIVESYNLPALGLEVHHFDLYRFAHPDEWIDAGLDELFHPHSLCLIEWPELGGHHVPPADVIIELTSQDQQRHLAVRALSAHGQLCLQQTDLSIWPK